MPERPSQSTPHGKGLWGWLGRQVGHVKKAVQTDPGGPQTIYRTNQIEEQPLPDQPGVKLRRTTIDEVIVDKTKSLGGKPSQTE